MDERAADRDIGGDADLRVLKPGAGDRPLVFPVGYPIFNLWNESDPLESQFRVPKSGSTIKFRSPNENRKFFGGGISEDAG